MPNTSAGFENDLRDIHGSAPMQPSVYEALHSLISKSVRLSGAGVKISPTVSFVGSTQPRVIHGCVCIPSRGEGACFVPSVYHAVLTRQVFFSCELLLSRHFSYCGDCAHIIAQASARKVFFPGTCRSWANEGDSVCPLSPPTGYECWRTPNPAS